MAVDLQKTFDWGAVRFAEYNQADWDKFYGSSECPRFGLVKNGRFAEQAFATEADGELTPGGGK